jgi:hypothetical protein
MTNRSFNQIDTLKKNNLFQIYLRVFIRYKPIINNKNGDQISICAFSFHIIVLEKVRQKQVLFRIFVVVLLDYQK